MARNRMFDDQGRPLYSAYIKSKDAGNMPEGWSIEPFFPGYTFDFGKSTYKNETVGEGGYVYSEPGMYGNVALLDIASMHPASIIAEESFGPEYTKTFSDIVNARLAIKHKDIDKARKMMGGKLEKHLTDEESIKGLSNALKIAINSVYGLTAAPFENPFKDNRNKDNIVAKRGALFMINLKHEVQARGYTVAHIKTDSIKIPDADAKIIKFVTDYGKEFGYTFEHENTYEKFCLVNDAVFIGKYTTGEWTATGTQFQVPYVFKKLFTHKDILFDDLCETKAVTTALYLDFNENLSEEEHAYKFVGRVGRFCPIKEGCGGAILLREKTNVEGYGAASGTKGYRWLESETVKNLGKEDDINRKYYDKQVDDAVKAISALGDFEWFVSDDPYIPVTTLPWD